MKPTQKREEEGCFRRPKNIVILGFQHDDMMREWEIWFSFFKYNLSAEWPLTTNVSTLYLPIVTQIKWTFVFIFLLIDHFD